MAKRETFMRYSLIIKKVRNSQPTFKEIVDYLKMESELQEYDFHISKRTFLRDIKDISSLFNIDIRYNFSKKVYYIENDEDPQANERILEAFDIFNALNITDRVSNYIHFEKRRSQGTEHLHGILHAIKNRVKISFTYYKYWENDFSKRNVEPYALKEFRSRWYLLAKDLDDNVVKKFGLDRISELTITRHKFKILKEFNVNDLFRNCFGIITPVKEKLQEVELLFTAFQGRYIKSMPLHESQQIIVDNENELRVKLKIYVTHDFIMELLSFGANVKVIKPNNLIDELKEAYEEALEQYK